MSLWTTVTKNPWHHDVVDRHLYNCISYVLILIGPQSWVDGSPSTNHAWGHISRSFHWDSWWTNLRRPRDVTYKFGSVAHSAIWNQILASYVIVNILILICFGPDWQNNAPVTSIRHLAINGCYWKWAKCVWINIFLHFNLSRPSCECSDSVLGV